MAAVIAAIALLAGCGEGSGSSGANAATVAGGCPQTVVRTLGGILQRIYHEGVESERTGAAKHIVEYSAPLREAIESGSSAAVLRAARALVASGHITNLEVRVRGRTLADLGHAALTPLSGTIKGAAGVPIATYETSVWSDAGFIAEGTGVTDGLVVLRAGSRSLAGATLPSSLPASEGTLSLHGVPYAYYSFPAEAYPAGNLRVFLLRTDASVQPLCGSSSEQTLVNTLSHIAALIYEGEVGSRTHAQIRRVEHDRPLLEAVVRREPLALRTAIDNLLNQHVVRIRVESSGTLLADVGGPYVLAPVGGTLRFGGRRIGTFLLSIQDDEGYLRLARRLAGLKVLMYMGTQLVKNSLGPVTGTIPASGRYVYHGQNFRVYTLHATAFPSGPLTIRVLIPIPYP